MVKLEKVVGVQGFEPWTPCSQSRCATRLRYTPTESIFYTDIDSAGNFLGFSKPRGRTSQAGRGRAGSLGCVLAQANESLDAEFRYKKSVKASD